MTEDKIANFNAFFWGCFGCTLGVLLAFCIGLRVLLYLLRCVGDLQREIDRQRCFFEILARNVQYKSELPWPRENQNDIKPS